MSELDLVSIASKRQKKREEKNLYHATEDPNSPKFFIPPQFPYPSGSGLHVGHTKNYVAADIIARKKLLQGYQVLHGMGRDAFGLPAENYAIKHKIHPAKAVLENIKNFRAQLDLLGASYDRDREINTTDPAYYKRTQWIFLQLYDHYYDKKLDKAVSIKKLKIDPKDSDSRGDEAKKFIGKTRGEVLDFYNGKLFEIPQEIKDYVDQFRLAYMDYKPINRCPVCKTGLANEDLENGKCERCGSEIEQRPMRQRVLRITKYADRLLKGLDNLNWEESMKELERNWIGRSEGTKFKIKIIDGNNKKKEVCISELFGVGLNWPAKTSIAINNNQKIKKINKKSKFLIKSIEAIINNNGKEIILDSKKLFKHFRSKSLKEFRYRKSLLGAVFRALKFIEFDERGIGYLAVNGKFVVKIVLGKEGDKYFVKTYYFDDRVTKAYQKFISKNFKVLGEIEVFTTRLDTVYGMSFVTLAPEHPLVEKITSAEQKTAVENYILDTKKKTQLDRVAQKEKTGVWTGAYAINPFNNQKVPVRISDYVLLDYGTGAVMAVPAHDERDREFAKKFNLPIRVVIVPEDFEGDIKSFEAKIKAEGAVSKKGKLINSEQYSGLKSDEAIEKMQQWLRQNGLGDKQVNYRLQDWVFSRQRYWGEPIPVIHCPRCGVVPLKEEDLPLKLPDVESYEPTGTEEGPLANISEWINVKCPVCGADARRESNTMPQRAGSSRYWIRYMDPKNDKQLVSPEKEKYWKATDVYLGGVEHVTRHMVYARFWNMFLYDIGVVSTEEPFPRFIRTGLVLAEDGRKMSKRRGNVVNPAEVMKEYGTDTLRVYQAFMGPYSQEVSRSTSSLKGTQKFLHKVWSLLDLVDKDLSEANDPLRFTLHKTIKKVSEDIENFKFNTAVAQLMIFVSQAVKQGKISYDVIKKFIILLSPFAPHLAEQMRENLGEDKMIFEYKNIWPEYNPDWIKEDEIEIGVQINGKTRGSIKISKDAEQDEVMEKIKEVSKFKKYLDGKEIRKVIYVPGKIVNIIV